MAAKKEIVITGKSIYKCTVQQPHRIISDVDRRLEGINQVFVKSQTLIRTGLTDDLIMLG
jgi:hypothetical protein